MSQSDLLQQATQGSAAAIESLINLALNPRDISAKVAWEKSALLVSLYAQDPLNQATLVNFVRKGLVKLGLSSIQEVRIESRIIDTELVVWTKIISFNSSSAKAKYLSRSPSKTGSSNTKARSIHASSKVQTHRRMKRNPVLKRFPSTRRPFKAWKAFIMLAVLSALCGAGVAAVVKFYFQAPTESLIHSYHPGQCQSSFTEFLKNQIAFDCSLE